MCPTEFPANLVWQPASSRTGSSKWWRFGGLFWSQSVYMSQNKTNWCCPEAFKVHMTPQNVLFRWRRRCKSISISNDQNMRQTTHCFPASCSSGKKRRQRRDHVPNLGKLQLLSPAFRALPFPYPPAPGWILQRSSGPRTCGHLTKCRLFGVETCRNIMEKQKDNKRWLEMNHSS